MNIIKCDACGWEFPKGDLPTKMKTEKDGTAVGYFQCENCKKIYVYNVVNDEIREKMNKIQELGKKEKILILSHARPKLIIKQQNMLVREREALKKKSKELMRKYQEIYNGRQEDGE